MPAAGFGGGGGCGKTRLALAAAEGLVGEYRDGAWLVELAATTGPERVPRAVAEALGLRERSDGSADLGDLERGLREALVQFLAPRHLLLVLDNCEHLAGACASMVDILLRRCPRLAVLATSREALGVEGERLYRVPSLAIPGSAALPPQELLTYEAVRLFVARARARRSSFALSAENAAAVAQICRRLDGIPLAIELAAARVGTLPVAGIAARLDDCFQLLTGGPRTVLPRQQTLRAAVDWSHDLLDTRERALFRRLSVFAGGWTLAAAEAVCAADGAPAIHAADVLDLLGGLVNKSLVIIDEHEELEVPGGGHAGGSRYRLLEPLRQYCWERLAAEDENTAVHERHAALFLSLAETAAPQLNGPEQLAWLARLAADQDNLRAALRWFLQRGVSDESQRFVTALSQFWIKRDSWTEARGWLEQALALPGSAPSKARASLLATAGWSAFLRDASTARRLFDEAVLIGRDLDERLALARALMGLGMLGYFQGDYARARVLLEEGLATSRALGDRWMIAEMLLELGRVVNLEGDQARAHTLLDEALAIAHQTGEHQQEAFALEVRGEVAFAEGDYAEAGRLWEESLATYQHLGTLLGVAMAENFLGLLALRLGDYATARARYQSGLEHHRGRVQLAVRSLAGLAGVVASCGQAERALRLAGAAAALADAATLRLPGPERDVLERAIETARAALGERAAAAAWAQGQAMILEQAVACALEECAAG